MSEMVVGMMMTVVEAVVSDVYGGGGDGAGGHVCWASKSELLADERERRRAEGELALQRRGVDDDGVVVEERAEPMGPAMDAEQSDGGNGVAEEGRDGSAS